MPAPNLGKGLSVRGIHDSCGAAKRAMLQDGPTWGLTMSREVAHTLSPREAAIIRMASEGHTDSSIAHLLEISEGTVGTYWGRIRTKMGPYSRPELVAIAIRT